MNGFLARGRVLPAVEADDFYDLVDVVDDALDDGGGFIVLQFKEEFGKGGFGPFLFFFGECVLLGLYGFAGDLAEFFDELDAGDEALLGFVAELLKTFAEVFEAWGVSVFFETFGEFLFQAFDFLWVSAAGDLVDDLGVEDVFLHVIGDAADMDVFVDQFGGLGSERVPEELADVVAAGFNGLIDAGEPAVVGLVLIENVGGAKGFPEFGEEDVVLGEGVALLIVVDAVLGGFQALEAVDGLIDSGEVGEAVGHGFGEAGF